jgi:hypothetical protein
MEWFRWLYRIISDGCHKNVVDGDGSDEAWEHP